MARRPERCLMGAGTQMKLIALTWCSGVERATGIEPAWPAWKAGALPLSYARKAARRLTLAYRLAHRTAVCGDGGEAPRISVGRVSCGVHGGMWRSLVSAPALGAGGREFESRHPDHEHPGQ